MANNQLMALGDLGQLSDPVLIPSNCIFLIRSNVPRHQQVISRAFGRYAPALLANDALIAVYKSAEFLAILITQKH